MICRKLRIHGDNIVECERALELLSLSFNAKTMPLDESVLYKPVYKVETPEISFVIELLSGHNRWGIDVPDMVLRNGGMLREGADAYITEIIGNTKETIILGIEFCSALPAGNNAWQRNGRAYACVMAGIPYIYFAEIGGVELDKERTPKSSRYPNPIVPFSYISFSVSEGMVCLPIYLSHPSMSDLLKDRFADVFGEKESLLLIKHIINGEDCAQVVKTILKKDIRLIEILSEERKRVDTLRKQQWAEMLDSNNRASWLIERTTPQWKKKISDKVYVTQTFKLFLNAVQAIPCYEIGADDLPICIVPKEKGNAFEQILSRIYPQLKFAIDWSKPLAIVWITGFKPKGDDSRPDRGLTPLTRMILSSSANIICIVYGPAKIETWQAFEESPKILSETNGLWQSILNICDYVFVDSTTCPRKIFLNIKHSCRTNNQNIEFDFINITPKFSEHDTDTAIHQIFSRKQEKGVYECLCNPPGGDWSGISYFMDDGREIRWTSLPRVSQVGGKRPDHVIQYRKDDTNIIISIESKRVARDLEANIGLNLVAYLKDLYSSDPTAERHNDGDWQMCCGDNYTLNITKILSVGAFIYNGDKDLSTALAHGNTDVVLGFDFSDESCTLHILAPKCEEFISLIKQITNGILGLEIQVH